jgi:POT family proton-dependent oligopeptide transporter
MEFLKQQPKILPFLFFAEIIQRFNYYGIQSVVLLYLIKHISIDEKNAYIIYGAFTALTFVMSIIGGVLADKLFSFYKIVLLGIFFTMIGVFSLGLTNLNYSIGLGFVICGIGLFLPNNASLLGSFYSQGDQQKQKGFSFFYMGTNIGGLLGPIIFGVIATYNWNYAFDFGGLCIFCWLLIYFFSRKIIINNFKTQNSKVFDKKQTLLFLGINIFFIISIIYLMHHPYFVGTSLYIIGVAVFAGMILVSKYQTKIDRNRIFLLLLMICIALLFFSFTFQIYSSLMIFIDKYIAHTLFEWKIPASSFASLEPLFIILLTPFFIKGWSILNSQNKEPSLFYKPIIGLGFCGISFLVFSLCAYLTLEGNLSSSLWILLGNLFLSAGEICIMPPLITAITSFSPVFLRGTIMGALYLSLAFSGYFSGKIASFSSGSTLSLNASYYSVLYIKIALFAFVASGILLVMFKINDNSLKSIFRTNVETDTHA